jgi:hypothetical protein
MSGPYDLDVMPTRTQAVILIQLKGGDRVVVTRPSGGYQLEGANLPSKKYEFELLINNQWITRPHPDGPLFGNGTEGVITPRGAAALDRYLEVHPHG